MKWYSLVILIYIIIGSWLATEAQFSIIKGLKIENKKIVKEVKGNIPILLQIVLVYPFIAMLPCIRDKIHRKRISINKNFI